MQSFAILVVHHLIFVISPKFPALTEVLTFEQEVIPFFFHLFPKWDRSMQNVAS